MSVEQIIALDARRLAKVLGLSVRTIRRLDCAGKILRPVHIGGAVYWCLAEAEDRTATIGEGGECR